MLIESQRDTVALASGREGAVIERVGAHDLSTRSRTRHNERSCLVQVEVSLTQSHVHRADTRDLPISLRFLERRIHLLLVDLRDLFDAAADLCGIVVHDERADGSFSSCARMTRAAVLSRLGSHSGHTRHVASFTTSCFTEYSLRRRIVICDGLFHLEQFAA